MTVTTSGSCVMRPCTTGGSPWNSGSDDLCKEREVLVLHANQGVKTGIHTQCLEI